MSETIIIPARFRGPPGSGNGGYVSGVVAGFIPGAAAEVTLRRPVPLDQALSVERSNGRVVVRNGDAVVAEAASASVDVELPTPPSYDEAVAASRRNTDHADKAYLQCFVCGADRAEGDGLRILAGPAAGRRLFAAPWRPHEAHADATGNIRPEYVWAALDCPGALAVLNGRKVPLLLGRFAARLATPVRAGGRYVVAAWSIGEEGRKYWAGTAIFSASGMLCAAARATWIGPKPAPEPPYPSDLDAIS